MVATQRERCFWGAGHWCFFVHKMVARLELSEFEQAYRAEGGELYAPAMMLSLGLYAYATGLTWAAELERRVQGRARAPERKRMRAKLRSSAGRALYARRKAMVEGVFGVLKRERELHRFRLRGLIKVGIEFTLATAAFNLTG